MVRSTSTTPDCDWNVPHTPRAMPPKPAATPRPGTPILRQKVARRKSLSAMRRTKRSLASSSRGRAEPNPGNPAIASFMALSWRSAAVSPREFHQAVPRVLAATTKATSSGIHGTSEKPSPCVSVEASARVSIRRAYRSDERRQRFPVSGAGFPNPVRSVEAEVLRDPGAVVFAHHEAISVDVPSLVEYSEHDNSVHVVRLAHSIRDVTDPRDIRRSRFDALAHAAIVRPAIFPAYGRVDPVKGFLRDGGGPRAPRTDHL